MISLLFLLGYINSVLIFSIKQSQSDSQRKRKPFKMYFSALNGKIQLNFINYITVGMEFFSVPHMN